MVFPLIKEVLRGMKANKLFLVSIKRIVSVSPLVRSNLCLGSRGGRISVINDLWNPIFCATLWCATDTTGVGPAKVYEPHPLGVCGSPQRTIRWRRGYGSTFQYCKTLEKNEGLKWRNRPNSGRATRYIRSRYSGDLPFSRHLLLNQIPFMVYYHHIYRFLAFAFSGVVQEYEVFLFGLSLYPFVVEDLFFAFFLLTVAHGTNPHHFYLQNHLT